MGMVVPGVFGTERHRQSPTRHLTVSVIALKLKSFILFSCSSGTAGDCGGVSIEKKIQEEPHK